MPHTKKEKLALCLEALEIADLAPLIHFLRTTAVPGSNKLFTIIIYWHVFDRWHDILQSPKGDALRAFALSVGHIKPDTKERFHANSPINTR